jgi:hypothetical protein
MFSIARREEHPRAGGEGVESATIQGDDDVPMIA